MLIGVLLIFFVESNLFYGGICGILSLILGFSIASFYAFTGVAWHAIKCIFTLQFSKVLRKFDELENSSQEKIGRKYGWIFILSSLFVYSVTAYFFMSNQNSDLVYYGVAGIVQGSLFWFAFANGYINFSELAIELTNPFSCQALAFYVRLA